MSKARQKSDIRTKIIMCDSDTFSYFVLASFNIFIPNSGFPLSLKLKYVTPLHEIKKVLKLKL